MFVIDQRNSGFVSFLIGFFPDQFTKLFIIYFMRVFTFLNSKFRCHFFLNLAMDFNVVVGKFNGFKHLFFRYLVHFTLNHHNIVV